jgi:hypothetical protein
LYHDLGEDKRLRAPFRSALLKVELEVSAKPKEIGLQDDSRTEDKSVKPQEGERSAIFYT